MSDTPKKAAPLPRHQGTVKWFSPEKGFGFIELPPAADGSKVADIFVHYRGIRGTGYLNLKDRQEVDFEIVKGAKGPQANDVVVTSDPNTEVTSLEPEIEEEEEDYEDDQELS